MTSWILAQGPPLWYCAFWVLIGLPGLYIAVRKATHHGQRDRDREAEREFRGKIL